MPATAAPFHRPAEGVSAQYEGRYVLVTTRDGYSFRGLAQWFEDAVVLHSAERVDLEKPEPAAGRVIVFKSNLSFFQALTDGDDA